MSAYDEKPQLPQLHNYDNRSYTESAFSYVPPIYSSQSSATVPTTAPVYHNATQLTPYSSNHTRATYENSSESYLNVGAAQLPDVTGYSPHKGVVGTKLFYLEFGHQKCQASLQKTSQQSASSYTITCDVPPFLSTNSARSTVTISLAMDSEDNDSTGKVIVGDFLYIDTGDESLYDNPREQSISRKRNRSFVSPELMKTPLKRTHSQHLRPKQEYSAYSYSQSDSLAACPTFTQQPNAQYNTSMVSPYGRPAAGYPAQVARRQAYEYPGSVSSAIKTSQSPHLGISNFGFPNINPSMSQSPGIMTNGSMNRSTSSSYPPPGPQENPELVRATLIPASSPSSAQHGPTYGNHVNFPAKVKLEIVGENVESMGDTRTWSREEFDLQRRLVHFSRTQSGSNVRAVCTAVSQEMKPGQGKEYATISAIHWKEKDLCYVTSVDVILLLEKLVGYKFTVEEKNRIRRNLEGYHPVTVSKGKTESEEFFKTIMGFPEPKPRNIEKDVKAFKWSDLVQALNKIMGKFVASPASVLGPIKSKAEVSTKFAIQSTPANNSSYPNAHYHNGPPSPRSISGSTASVYNLPTRVYSPHDQRSASLQTPLGSRNNLSNLHDSASHWSNHQPHMQNLQHYLGTTSNRNASSWDMPSYSDYNQASAGSSTTHSHSYNYPTPRIETDSAGLGSENRISRDMPSQSQQVPRS